MSKPPSRKHYERTKPTYKELEDRLEVCRLSLLSAETYERELKGLLQQVRMVADWFDVLKRSEVMVLTPEGMKYLVGQDLENFCKAEIEKQNACKVWWGDTSEPFSFARHTQQHLSKIIADEIDNCAVADAITYKTQGRQVFK